MEDVSDRDAVLMEIRIAVLRDEERLLELGRQMLLESPHFCNLTFNKEKSREYLQGCMYRSDRLALVAERGEEVIGFLLAFTQDYYMADEVFVEDAALYVVPESRGSSAAPRLLKAYREWAEERGAVHCYMGTNTGVKAEKTLKLFQHCGFTPLGYSLVREV